MPNTKIESVKPNTLVKNEQPNTSVPRFEAGSLILKTIYPGNPIGLLLALTYAVEINFTESLIGQKPNTSILNN